MPVLARHFITSRCILQLLEALDSEVALETNLIDRKSREYGIIDLYFVEKLRSFKRHWLKTFLESLIVASCTLLAIFLFPSMINFSNFSNLNGIIC